jgi:hypothetical protein
MASALDMLPADTRAMVDAGDPRLRDDLLGIAAAEAAGWTVEFERGDWANSARFVRGTITFWISSLGWRSAICGTERAKDIITHPTLADALERTE